MIGWDRPASKYLYRHVKNGVCRKWHDLGLEQLDPEHEAELHAIKINNPADVQKCCGEMMQLWLEKCPTATWNQLLEALRAPGIELMDLASKLQRKLLSSQGTYIEQWGYQVYFTYEINVCQFFLIGIP